MSKLDKFTEITLLFRWSHEMPDQLQGEFRVDSSQSGCEGAELISFLEIESLELHYRICRRSHFSIKNFDVSRNSFVGIIPKSIGSLKNVEQIELFRNKLSVELPDRFSGLYMSSYEFTLNRWKISASPSYEESVKYTKLIKKNAFIIIIIQGILCFLWGCEGAELISFVEIESLELHYQICRRSHFSIKNIDVSRNNFVGIIPKIIGSLKNVEQIELFRNKHSVELPDSFSGLY
ncbi:hypothetical protein MIMGU_mgv11b023304mg, partial [Erythranthe guttata]